MPQTLSQEAAENYVAHLDKPSLSGYLVCPVYLVQEVHLVYSVCLVCLVERN